MESSLRIGINALYLLPGKVGGTETYLRNLVKWLGKISSRKDDDYFIFINAESDGIFEEIAPQMNVVRCNVRAASRPLRILYEQFVLPLRVKLLGLDVLLCPGMTAPFVSFAPSVVVIYDLQHVNMPENFAWFQRVMLKSIIYLSAKVSRSVIVISNHVKRDVVRHYKIAPSKIHVTYIAVDRKLFRRRDVREIASVCAKYNLPQRYIFYAASSLPHKNTGRLLDAFKIVSTADKEIGLVLTGARDYGHDAISGKIAALGLKDSVVFLGWLPAEDLSAIYSGAEVFVFPSLHEGFGMPVIEAFSCGTPVVCSGIEPMTEVADDAAFFVDPLNVDDIARGITAVMNDKGLRLMLIEKGLKRSLSFDWKNTAVETHRIMKSAAKV